MKTYLLDNNYNYKLLIFHAMKKLEKDIKQKIYDILIIHEITELNILMEFIEQNWTTLTITNLYELDYFRHYRFITNSKIKNYKPKLPINF